jgi:hypothetical protein
VPNYLKKFTYALVIAFICFSAVSPTKTHAQAAPPVAVPVVEVGSLLLNTVDINIATNADSCNTAQTAAKETGVGACGGVPVTGVEVAATAGISADAIGLTIGKTLIRQFTKSVVSWINTGFQGNPSFVTDPAGFFINTADIAAGKFIEGSELGFLCDPIHIRLALNISYSASFKDRITCTLTEVVQNLENFSQDFTQGGWDGWFSMTQHPANNPWGEYYVAKVEMDRRIAEAVGLKQDDLQRSGGFLSWQECLDPPLTQDDVEDGATGECQEYGPIRTPGKVIESQLESSLDSDLSQLELADDFDEIIGALTSQVIKQVITQAGGLLGS